LNYTTIILQVLHYFVNMVIRKQFLVIRDEYGKNYCESRADNLILIRPSA